MWPTYQTDGVKNRNMRSKNNFAKRFGITLVVTVALVSGLTARNIEPQDYDQLAVQAYIYGYPLVVLSRLRKLHTLSKQGMEGIRAPINTIAHSSRLLNAKDPRDSITPNHDTLQSNAWLDLASEPQVLQIP